MTILINEIENGPSHINNYYHDKLFKYANIVNMDNNDKRTYKIKYILEHMNKKMFILSQETINMLLICSFKQNQHIDIIKQLMRKYNADFQFDCTIYNLHKVDILTFYAKRNNSLQVFHFMLNNVKILDIIFEGNDNKTILNSFENHLLDIYVLNKSNIYNSVREHSKTPKPFPNGAAHNYPAYDESTILYSKVINLFAKYKRNITQYNNYINMIELLLKHRNYKWFNMLIFYNKRNNIIYCDSPTLQNILEQHIFDLNYWYPSMPLVYHTKARTLKEFINIGWICNDNKIKI